MIDVDSEVNNRLAGPLDISLGQFIRTICPEPCEQSTLVQAMAFQI